MWHSCGSNTSLTHRQSLRKTLKKVLRFAVTGVLPANLDSDGESRPADIDGVERCAMGDPSTPPAGRDRGALQQTLARTLAEDK
jgi:hypothetical protein